MIPASLSISLSPPPFPPSLPLNAHTQATTYNYLLPVQVVWKTKGSAIETCPTVDIYLYQSPPPLNLPTLIATLAKDHPNDYQVRP